MSILTTPVALIDLLFIPSYWIPHTIYKPFGLPVGIEGFIFSFELGGVAAVAYEFFERKRLIKIKNYHQPIYALIMIGLGFPILYLLLNNVINIALILYLFMIFGTVLIIHIRQDLIKSSILGFLIFGTVYFINLLIWVTIFPETTSWFNFEGLPKIFILNVPFYEALLGAITGAFWGNMYEFIFGYKYNN